MNQLGAGTLSDLELILLRVDASALIQDADTGRSVVLKRQGVRSFSPEAGRVSYTETSTTVTAWRSVVTEDEGQVRKGDVRWLVRSADLSETPQPDDRVVDGSETWTVYQVDIDPIAATISLFSRRA